MIDFNCAIIGSKISDWTVREGRGQTQEYSQCAYPEPQKGGWTILDYPLIYCYYVIRPDKHEYH